MKCIKLSAALALAVLISGCHSEQGESPKENQAEAQIPRDIPAGSMKPSASLPSPMSVAGDPIAGQSRQSMPNKPVATSDADIRSMPGGAAAPPKPPIARSPMMSMPADQPSRTNSIKADKEVSGYYKNPDGMSISVVAICKVTEDTITCKKPDGSRDKDLEAKLDRLFQGEHNRYSPGISFKYKKKNRLILFKKEYPTLTSGPMAHASISQVGDDMSSMGMSYVNVQGLSEPYNQQGPRVEYEMRAVSVPSNQKSVDAYISSTKPTPIEGVLKLTKGSKLSSGKYSISYVSQKPSEDRMYGASTKMWEIAFRTTRPDTKAHFSFNAIVNDNKYGFVEVDQNGDIFKRDQNMSNEPGPARRNDFMARPVMFIPVSMTQDETKVRTNVNPKHITGLSVIIMRTETVKLKNIRLD